MQSYVCFLLSIHGGGILLSQTQGFPLDKAFLQKIDNATWKQEIDRNLQNLVLHLENNFPNQLHTSFQRFIFISSFLSRAKWQECAVCRTKVKSKDVNVTWSLCKMVVLIWDQTKTNDFQKLHFLKTPAVYGMNLTITRLISAYSGR